MAEAPGFIRGSRSKCRGSGGGHRDSGNSEADPGTDAEASGVRNALSRNRERRGIIGRRAPLSDDEGRREVVRKVVSKRFAIAACKPLSEHYERACSQARSAAECRLG